MHDVLVTCHSTRDREFHHCQCAEHPHAREMCDGFEARVALTRVRITNVLERRITRRGGTHVLQRPATTCRVHSREHSTARAGVRRGLWASARTLPGVSPSHAADSRQNPHGFNIIARAQTDRLAVRTASETAIETLTSASLGPPALVVDESLISLPSHPTPRWVRGATVIPR